VRTIFFRNRKVLYSFIVILLVVAGVLAKSFIDQRSANRALRARILSLNKERRIAKPWSEILKPSGVATASSSQVSPVQNATGTPPVSVSVGETSLNLTDLSTQELAALLSANMIEVKNLKKEDLEKTIEIADEVILREPSSYTAYKAKLITLLVKEGKFKEEVEDAQVDELLETMASFDTSGRENIIASAEAEQIELEDRVTGLYAEIEENYSMLQSMDKSSPEAIELELRQQDISNQYKEANDALLASNKTLEQALYGQENINRDLVEIPFLRMMAKNDYDGVIENAQNFIEEFPGSTDGYFYLARAYEKQGMTDQAQSVINGANLNSQSLDALNKRIQNSRQENVQNYWQGLRF
jgi:hypothetical protein